MTSSARLNTMNPQPRGRILDRNEALERLSPPERQQWRDVVANSSTPYPCHAAARGGPCHLDLREMPPEQREQTIDSQAFGAQFAPNERNMIRTLLTAEPYPPARAANEIP